MMKTSHKLWSIVASTIFIWLFCSFVAASAMGQVGLTVPLRVRICNSIYNVLYFPWSWLPKYCFTWGRTGMDSVRPNAMTIGLLWAIPVGLCMSYILFRKNRKA
jgi:hypothetical protein